MDNNKIQWFKVLNDDNNELQEERVMTVTARHKVRYCQAKAGQEFTNFWIAVNMKKNGREIQLSL